MKILLILLSLSLIGDPGGGASGSARPPPLKKIHVLCFFSSLRGPFSPCGRPFLLPFSSIILYGGGGGAFVSYVEIYLDLSPLAKISAGINAFVA